MSNHTATELKEMGAEIARLTAETNDVAKIIVSQINGLDYWARARWGVKKMIADRFGGSPGHVGNPGVKLECTHGIIVKIALMPSDTYTVRIGKLGRKGTRMEGMFIEKGLASDDVYAEDLVRIIDGMFSKNYP